MALEDNQQFIRKNQNLPVVEEDSEGADLQLDRDLIVEALPDLSDASTKVLNHLLEIIDTSDDQQAAINALADDLHNPASRFLKLFKPKNQLFVTYLEQFGTTDYIDVKTIVKALYGVPLCHAPRTLRRPDSILQKANVVSFVTSALTSSRDSTRIYSTLQRLDRSFPEPFLTGLWANSVSSSTSPGRSILLRETFEIALELRTQLAIIHINSHKDEPEYDPNRVLQDLFYISAPHDNSPIQTLTENAEIQNVKGWKVPILDESEGGLTVEMREEICTRVKCIRTCIRHSSQSLQKSTIDIEPLLSQFSWGEFLMRVILWARLRISEIEEELLAGGGIKNLQESLLKQIHKAIDTVLDDSSAGSHSKSVSSIEPLAATSSKIKEGQQHAQVYNAKQSEGA